MDLAGQSEVHLQVAVEEANKDSIETKQPWGFMQMAVQMPGAIRKRIGLISQTYSNIAKL